MTLVLSADKVADLIAALQEIQASVSPIDEELEQFFHDESFGKNIRPKEGEQERRFP